MTMIRLVLVVVDVAVVVVVVAVVGGIFHHLVVLMLMNEMHECRRGLCVRLQCWSPDADGDARTIRILSVTHDHVKGKRLHGIYAGEWRQYHIHLLGTVEIIDHIPEVQAPVAPPARRPETRSQRRARDGEHHACDAPPGCNVWFKHC